MNTITKTLEKPAAKENTLLESMRECKEKAKMLLEQDVRKEINDLTNDAVCTLDAWAEQAMAIYRMAGDSYYTEEAQLESIRGMARCLAQAINDSKCMTRLDEINFKYT